MIRRHFYLLCVFFLVFSMTICNTNLAAIAASAQGTAGATAPAADKPQTADDVAAQYQAESITKKGQETEPTTTTSNTSGNTLLYGGLAVAGIVGAVALAAGSGGGGSSDVVEEPVEPKEEPVGADLAGESWHGRLILADSGFKEEVTATVKQNGSELEITTSSTQKYGKKFIGKINRNANITVRDQDTGQDWTTHYDKARWNMIDLYDYVHNFHDMDRLYLTRESKM